MVTLSKARMMAFSFLYPPELFKVQKALKIYLINELRESEVGLEFRCLDHSAELFSAIPS